MDEGDLLMTILDEIISDVAQASDIIAVDGGLIIEVIVDCDGWNVAFDEGFDLWIFEIDRGDDDAIAAAEFGVFVIGEFGFSGVMGDEGNIESQILSCRFDGVKDRREVFVFKTRSGGIDEEDADGVGAVSLQ